MHQTRGVGNKAVFCGSAILRVLFQCYNTSDTTVYCIQFTACTCQISEGGKRKILRCYKSSKQKKEIAMKKRKSYAELEPVKKKLCLERFCNHYNNVKNKKKDYKD